MSRLLCLSITSAALALALAAAGCSDGADCGPHGAAADGIVASGSGATLTFGMLVGSPNADCGVTNGIVSVTISGTQVDATGTAPTFLTLCVPRPDHLGGGLAIGSDFIVQDVTGSSGACTYMLDPATPPSGTAKSSGLCNNGTSKAGFALTIDAQLALQRKCGTVTDSIAATLAGTAAVAGPP